MAILNYTTKIPPEQTIGEIQKELAEYNVSAMMTEYEGRQVSGVSFRMNIDGKDMAFRMPCNWRAVLEVMKNDRKIPRSFKTDDQAIRTAWRILLVWVKAQLALVEINMVTVPQVFLPYTIMRDNRTLAEHVSENPSFLLEATN